MQGTAVGPEWHATRGANWRLTTPGIPSKWLVWRSASSSTARAPCRWPGRSRSQIERLIREAWLAPGVKLPATRELAQTLGVNRTTVALAYEELVAAGRARAHVGQGTFVAASPAGGGRPRRPLAGRVPLDWSRLFSRSAHIGGSGARAPGRPARRRPAR